MTPTPLSWLPKIDDSIPLKSREHPMKPIHGVVLNDGKHERLYDLYKAAQNAIYAYYDISWNSEHGDWNDPWDMLDNADLYLRHLMEEII